MSWTYCSFAGQDGFYGGLILQGRHAAYDARALAMFLNIDPGGEMMTITIPDSYTEVCEINANKLLSTDDLQRIFGEAENLKDLQHYAGRGYVVGQAPDFRADVRRQQSPN